MADDGSWADDNKQEENLVSFSGLKSRAFLYRVKRIQQQSKQKNKIK